jgi:hypothetical protein
MCLLLAKISMLLSEIYNDAAQLSRTENEKTTIMQLNLAGLKLKEKEKLQKTAEEELPCHGCESMHINHDEFQACESDSNHIHDE